MQNLKISVTEVQYHQVRHAVLTNMSKSVTHIEALCVITSKVLRRITYTNKYSTNRYASHFAKELYTVLATKRTAPREKHRRGSWYIELSRARASVPTKSDPRPPCLGKVTQRELQSKHGHWHHTEKRRTRRVVSMLYRVNITRYKTEELQNNCFLKLI